MPNTSSTSSMKKKVREAFDNFTDSLESLTFAEFQSYVEFCKFSKETEFRDDLIYDALKRMTDHEELMKFADYLRSISDDDDIDKRDHRCDVWTGTDHSV